MGNSGQSLLDPQKRVHSVNPTIPAWERVYQKRGELWGGSVPKLPDLPAGSRVLDLGCGNGRILSAAVARGWQIVAADISSHAVEIAKAAMKGIADTEFLVADAGALPFRDCSFDAVIAWHVLGHGDEKDRKRMIRELARILNEEGKVFFRGFSREDMRCGKGTATEPGTFVRGDGILTHYFSEEETREMFREFDTMDLTTERWSMRIRGKDHPRAEIAGTFLRKN